MEMIYKANTKTSDTREGIHSFLLPSSQRFVSDYLDKIVWIMILFLIAYPVLIVKNISLYGMISLLFLCTISFLFGKIQKKFAHEIVLDFTSGMALFHMNRGNKFLEVNFEDVENIRLNGYIIFGLKERKVFYAESQNKQLLKCLNKIKTIEWGVLCSLFGPNKNVRDKILSDSKLTVP